MDAELPLSVLLLARDETRALESLIPALAWAREVVVVWDARGAQETRTAAERLGARVFARPLEDFGAQRRFALEQCREPWVLWIDADERLDETGVAALRAALAAPAAAGDGPAAFTLERRSWFLGRRIRFCGWQRERLTRVFRRERARFADAALHERVIVAGPIAQLAGTLEHHSYPTWAECVRKLTAYAHAGALQAAAAGRRAGATDVIARPPLRFLRMYVLQLGFLDGVHGALLCALAAAQVLLKYAELWAMSRGRRTTVG